MENLASCDQHFAFHVAHFLVYLHLLLFVFLQKAADLFVYASSLDLESLDIASEGIFGVSYFVHDGFDLLSRSYGYLLMTKYFFR